MSERRYDIDWLRVVAMLAIFVYHCTRFFDVEGWHLKNPEQSEALFIAMRALIWPWVMELFFLVSGVGTWYALKSRQPGEYVGERIRRLLVPLYTVGLFLLLPPQYYFEITTNQAYRDDFASSIPRFLGEMGLPSLSNEPGGLIPVSWSGHLWFLQYLFLISLLTLPMVLYLRSAGGQQLAASLASWSQRRGGVFLFLLPLALSLIVFRAVFGPGRSWADLIWYALYFVIGYIAASDGRFTEAFTRERWLALTGWAIGFLGVALIALGLGYEQGVDDYSPLYLLFQVAWSIGSWSSVVFVLGMGAKHLNANHRVLAYANEAVLPFYLLHQTVILIVGYFVLRWDIGILPKLLIVAGVSFPLILGLYEVLVRPYNVVRFLFGMRPRRAAPVPSEASTATV